MGLDDKGLEGSVPRVVTFEVDGQSLLRAQVSGATGPVQLCLWREAVDDQRTCHTAHSVIIQHAVLDAGSTIWHASIIGAAGGAPVASLAVTFNSTGPNIQLDNFRYLGKSRPSYNGFEAVLTTSAAGDLSVQASFDGPETTYNYHLVIQPEGGNPIFDQSGGPSESIDQTQAVDGGTVYHAILSDPDDTASATGPVFVTANLMWP